MANSKSNIYPIQLQGAELCLNRYDAEIKQYRGFNKNNSPFVGGCLSNVFTKEEQISGGNADNTYIDTNGNVYRVDTEGFYKNDEKIIEYNSYTKFYEKRKLRAKGNVVKMLSESVYISLENNNYVAHWGDNFSNIIGPIKTEMEAFLDISYKNGAIAFTYKRYRFNSALYAFLYTVVVPDENDEYCYVLKPAGDDDTVEGYTCCKIPSAFLDNSKLKYCPLSQAAYIEFDEEDENKLYVFVAFNEDNGDNGRCYISGVTSASCLNIIKIDKNDRLHNESVHVYYFDNPDNVSGNYFSRYLCGYYMTNDGVFHFNHLPYANNDTHTSTWRDGKYTFPSTAEIYVNLNLRISHETDHWSGAFYDVARLKSFDYGYDYYRNPQDTGVQGTTIVNKDFDTYYRKSNNYFSPYGVFFASRFVNKDDVTKELILAFANNLKSGVVTAPDEYVDGGFCIYGDFKILFNNGNLSSISVFNKLPESNLFDTGLFYNYHGVLVEDWNVVSDIIIPASGDRIIYKKNNEFYEVYRTTEPKIYKKYNQLVVNCCNELNCYSLELERILHYGSDWNCSYLTGLTRYITYANSYNRYGNIGGGWIASAINEYEQENNPSIILNAKEYIPCALVEATYIGELSAIKRHNYICAVNVYIGSATPTYVCSVSTGEKINVKLIDLPFPNNTDGNVQSTPNLFSEFIYNFGIDVFVRNDKNVYQLMKVGQENIMSYFLGTLVEGLEKVFIIQGQYYGIINNKIFSLQFQSGVIAGSSFIVNIQGLQFVGNTPYEALFFSKTNRCLYSFTGANVLNQKQLVDKISEVRNYLYNPATQTVFLITDIGVLFYGLFGMFLLEYTNISNIFLLDNGIVMSDNSGNYRYIKYYLDEGDTDYTKENINVETSFYGMNNEVVTINDCLYFRIFSEEHEEGDLKVSATTISLRGRKTEETTFKIKASDWDKITHTIYLRYQPKTQRGLGVAFAIDSPFKIASLSVGSQPDAVLVDKVSKGAIIAPSVTTNNNEW